MVGEDHTEVGAPSRVLLIDAVTVGGTYPEELEPYKEAVTAATARAVASSKDGAVHWSHAEYGKGRGFLEHEFAERLYHFPQSGVIIQVSSGNPAHAALATVLRLHWATSVIVGVR